MSTDETELPLGDLSEIEMRADAATPGPWKSMRDGNQRYGEQEQFFCGASRVDGLPRAYNTRYVIPAIHLEHVSRFKDADADFIAHAREDVPRLIAEIRRLRSTQQPEDGMPNPMQCSVCGAMLRREDAHVWSIKAYCNDACSRKPDFIESHIKQALRAPCDSAQA